MVSASCMTGEVIYTLERLHRQGCIYTEREGFENFEFSEELRNRGLGYEYYDNDGLRTRYTSLILFKD